MSTRDDNQSPFDWTPPIEPEVTTASAPGEQDGPRLTVEKCIAQFRMYAEGHSDLMAKHQLNFCADFLRDHGPATTASASIGQDKQFNPLVSGWAACRSHYEDDDNEHVKTAWDELTRYIDSRAPAPSRDAAPLTRQQIAQGFKSYPQYAYGAFEDGVRFAEKHHGIGAALAQQSADLAAGGEMPPLPEPRAIRDGDSFPKVYALAYTVDQMREYGAACVAAARAGSNAGDAGAVAWCVANPNGDYPPVLIYGNGAVLKPGDKLCLAASVPVGEAVRELDRIKRMAACGTVDAFMAMPDALKRTFFALVVDESERLKLAERRFTFLHSTNNDAEGWEWGVARVRVSGSGAVQFLWGVTDHSDLDAAMLAAAPSRPDEPAGERSTT